MSKKITEYTIIEGTEVEVGKKMYILFDEGWQPFGSLSVVVTKSEYSSRSILVYSQAIVKYKSKK